MNPRYIYPSQIIVGPLRDLILLRGRSFREDSRANISKLESRLQIRGEENISSRGRFVLIMNHYTRTGFQIWWAALAISSVLPSPIHWIITSERTAPGKWYEPIKSACLPYRRKPDCASLQLYKHAPHTAASTGSNSACCFGSLFTNLCNT